MSEFQPQNGRANAIRRPTASRPCIFCGEPSSRQGEHVLPKWLLKRWSDEGCFTHERNGERICDRDGAARTTNHLPRILLPVCDRNTSPNDCNGTLNQLYELPGKLVVREVLDGTGLVESPEQVEKFARWWVKTILLRQHPDCRSTFERREQGRTPGNVLGPAWDLPASVYQNLIKGILPSDVSLWLAISDDFNGRGQLPELMRINLPATSTPEGDGGEPATLLWGFRQMHTRLVLLQMVVHPLCDFEHPFEQAGLCVRLWPEPPRSLDVTRCAVLGLEGRCQLGALFVAGGSTDNLPAGGWRVKVAAVPDGGPLRA